MPWVRHDVSGEGISLALISSLTQLLNIRVIGDIAVEFVSADYQRPPPT